MTLERFKEELDRKVLAGNRFFNRCNKVAEQENPGLFIHKSLF